MSLTPGTYRVHSRAAGWVAHANHDRSARGTEVTVADNRATWTDEDGEHVYEARKGARGLTAVRVGKALPRGKAETTKAMATAVVRYAAAVTQAVAEPEDVDVDDVLEDVFGGRRRLGPSAEIVDGVPESGPRVSLEGQREPLIAALRESVR